MLRTEKVFPIDGWLSLQIQSSHCTVQSVRCGLHIPATYSLQDSGTLNTALTSFSSVEAADREKEERSVRRKERTGENRKCSPKIVARVSKILYYYLHYLGDRETDPASSNSLSACTIDGATDSASLRKGIAFLKN